MPAATTVLPSLRLLCLIFQKVLGLMLLLGRTCGCRELGHVMRQHVFVYEAAEPGLVEACGWPPQKSGGVPPTGRC